MIEEARLSGLPGIEREPFYHKEHGLLFREALERFPGSRRVVTVYIGLEVSLVAWRDGKVIDADNYLTGDSPMGVITSGWLPNSGILTYYYEERKAVEEIQRLICGEGGLKSYYGTEDMEALSRKEWDTPLEAFLYWIAKGVGGMSATLKGRPDVVMMGGPWIGNPLFLRRLRERLSFLQVVESERIR